MKKLSIWITASLLIFFTSCTKDSIDQILDAGLPVSDPLTNEEVIQGLRQALNIGTDTSVSILNKPDGYYKDELVKILMPPEAAAVYERISNIPGGSALIENTIIAMNRAAEDAAKEAAPIFTDAITGMTISDGFTILNGADTAATSYLKNKTYPSLFTAFRPKINESLVKPLWLGLSAEETYSKLISFYNTASVGGLLFDQITANSLSTHVTEKALNGLFVKVADQEKKIRKDPLAQVTDLLKKIFGKK